MSEDVHSAETVVCIIPARGGSKGIPRKNLVPIGGVPLVEISIRQALRAKRVRHVVVSTDDAEIASVARNAGALVIARPPEICGDDATSESALAHAIDMLATQYRIFPTIVVFLQATSPMRRPDDIDNALDLFVAGKADSLFSARRIEGFIWKRNDNSLVPLDYDPTSRPRRQDLKAEILEENGSIYIFRPSILREHRSRLGGTILSYEMSPLDSWQIDEPGDLAVIQQLAPLRMHLADTHEPTR